MEEGSNVRVAVRVRPMNQREKKKQSTCVISMKGNKTILKSNATVSPGKLQKRPKEFIYDHCFSSTVESDSDTYAGQEEVFKTLAEGIIENIYQGYNVCIFAYGQTGSGKTYSMLGTDDEPGLIPRFCCAILNRESEGTVRVELSYMEIYNEKVRDLLKLKKSKKELSVREHNILGPYVEGLSQHAVSTWEDIKLLLVAGNKCRTTAATKMNEESSRSHAIFTLTITQTFHIHESGTTKELHSKFNLVDLAGSERVSKSGAQGKHLVESGNINKSLTTLGRVISSLAEGNRRLSSGTYRESVLTRLLKNSLGGNSKTVMLATISPADENYGETHSTLEYATRARKIVNQATVNEDTKCKAVATLQAEVQKLKEQLKRSKSHQSPDLQLKLKESENLLTELNLSWEEKLKKTEETAKVMQKYLESMGISVEASGIKCTKDKCFLYNTDPKSNDYLLYYLTAHNKIGAGSSQDFQLSGPGIEEEHCVITMNPDGCMFLVPNINAEVQVNGTLVQEQIQLYHEDKINVGSNYSFILNQPKKRQPNHPIESKHQLEKNEMSSDHESMNENNPKHDIQEPHPYYQLSGNKDDENELSMSSCINPNKVEMPAESRSHDSQSSSSIEKVLAMLQKSQDSLTELQQNFQSLVEKLESKQLINQQDCAVLENTDDMILKSKTLLNLISEKGENACAYFLEMLGKDIVAMNIFDNGKEQNTGTDQECHADNSMNKHNDDDDEKEENTEADNAKDHSPPATMDENSIDKKEEIPNNVQETVDGVAMSQKGGERNEEKAEPSKKMVDDCTMIELGAERKVEKSEPSKDEVAMSKPGDERKEVNTEPSKDKKNLFIDLLKKMNMDPYESKKITLQDFLQIDGECLQKMEDWQKEPVAWNFIRKIIALNETARSIFSKSADANDVFQDATDDIMCDSSNIVHPLDVLCLVLHCCDHFLQQEIILKMSMCQFAVPLLLPDADGQGCTFMLWGLREIVKRWRPQSLAETKGFMQANLVQISMPTFSFVRLGESKSSKSSILNQVLSPAQHTHDFFVHSNMEGADVPREISEGLVEISWYFPAGKSNSDVFQEPVAFANLHGNLEDNLKQFAFITQISSAVFIFAQNIDQPLYDFLSQYKNSQTNFVIIVKKDIKIDKSTNLTNVFILQFKSHTSEAIIVKKIQAAAINFITKKWNLQSLEDMSEIAFKLGIYVDENVIECENAKADAKAIADEIKDVADYKKNTMRLQGNLWKKLAYLEKEMCQMKKQGDKHGESYKVELKKQIVEKRKQQYHCEMPNGISKFIDSIKKRNHIENHYFFKWLRFYLDLSARKNLSALQAEYKEKSVTYSKTELSGLDQKISDSSLGIEHFLRELGQFYEAEHFMLKGEIEKKRKFTQLPEFAADLLLNGFPLELVDGDASNIPLQWLRDVLTELEKKTGKCSRMGVITVLGVQSTGKSTLLNTMFGLQFPVSSGRCTRGAFMTLMKVRENFQGKLGCEFILVIDTEGLRAPELASLENSYEHDNELATLVVGLSDITIVNMAMENTTEMKDILQIVVHAFLRMKEIGRKPNCYFVHQNVSDVSAHENNRRDRVKLLEHLNEMTKIAANMEKKPKFAAFSDIMMYDAEKDNSYIPGLWNGVPPMASINIAYSETIYELKAYLIEGMKNKGHRIGDFIEWIESLWNAVKYENFIFSFRNSLVANAYNQLAKKHSELEWKFTKAMHNWLAETETVIKNQNAQTVDSEAVKCKYAAHAILSKEEGNMQAELEKYFSSENKDASLIERYKAEFLTSASCLRKKLEASSISKCDEAIRIQKENLKVKNVISSYKEVIDKKVTSLVLKCKDQKCKPDEKTLEEEFEEMWAEIIAELNITALPEPNIELELLTLLIKDMASKGSSVNQRLNNINQLPKQENLHLHENMVKSALKKIRKTLPFLSSINGPDKLEVFFKSLSDECSEYIKNKLSSESDYNESYGLELLNLINSVCDGNKDLQITADNELDLKLFILGNAVGAFQQMHKEFVRKNDPLICLGEKKPKYYNSFQYLFLEKDENWERAKHFCTLWLKPALIEQVNRKLGFEIVDHILDNSEANQYSTRGYFQFTVMKTLLEKSIFSDYLEYINDYEIFVKKWIDNCILEKCDFHHLQSVILSNITRKIKGFLNESKTCQFQNVSDFLAHLKKGLRNDLVLSDDMDVFCLKDETNIKEFVENLEKSLNDTEAKVIIEMKAVDKKTIFSNVVVKPADELFKRIFGCGKQCPFCRVPCEAGGIDHKSHFASIHRPTGLGRFRSFFTQILCHDICTTNISGNKSFIVEGHFSHPYKEYKTFYPEWDILPDRSIEASDYWKYVLKEFNGKFAEEYEARPAEYPEEWNVITEAQAERCLNTAFGMQLNTT